MKSQEPPRPENPILFVDDERPWLESLAFALEYEAGIDNIRLCEDPRECLDILASGPFSLVLLDVNMPHRSGPELLEDILSRHPDLPVVMLSGAKDLKTAVECLKSGARDYLVKTEKQAKILQCIEQVITEQQLQAEKNRIDQEIHQIQAADLDEFAGIITHSSQMYRIFRYLKAVAETSEPILITGESGTGKELIAQAIHRIRSIGELVIVNLAGLDDNMFSDTLFGHTRGAFSSANTARDGMVRKAGKGCLFLDEIGDITPASQVKLLRLIQNGTYYPLGGDAECRSEAKIIVATNRDLQQISEAGTFREDLFYRLNTHHVHLPPLRDRKEDIELLARHFLREAQQEMQTARTASFSKKAIEFMQSFDWPGNIRQLRSVVYDVLSRAQGNTINYEDLFQVPSLAAVRPSPKEGTADPSGIIFPPHLPTIDDTVNQLVQEAMKRGGGKQTAAARLLGVTPQAVSKRLKKKGS